MLIAEISQPPVKPRENVQADFMTFMDREKSKGKEHLVSCFFRLTFVNRV